eukprot:gene4767-biopygen7486
MPFPTPRAVCRVGVIPALPSLCDIFVAAKALSGNIWIYDVLKKAFGRHGSTPAPKGNREIGSGEAVRKLSPRTGEPPAPRLTLSPDQGKLGDGEGGPKGASESGRAT